MFLSKKNSSYRIKLERLETTYDEIPFLLQALIKRFFPIPPDEDFEHIETWVRQGRVIISKIRAKYETEVKHG